MAHSHIATETAIFVATNELYRNQYKCQDAAIVTKSLQLAIAITMNEFCTQYECNAIVSVHLVGQCGSNHTCDLLNYCNCVN